METVRKSTFANRIALAIGITAFLMLIGGIGLMITRWELSSEFIDGEFGYVLIFFAINGVLSVLLGILIIWRNPANRLGWIFLSIGFLFCWWEFSVTVLEGIGLEEIPVPLQPIVIAGTLSYLLPLMMTTTLVPLYFPTGNLLSRRWRLVLILALIGMIGQTLTQGLLDLFEELPELEPERFGPIVVQAYEITGFIIVVGILGSILSLIIRFRRSRGDERTRMKWLVYTAVMSILLMLLLSATLGEDSVFLGIFSSAIPIYLTLAIGIAILRHRLFDIDLVVRRTLQYALITGVLALAYFGGIVVLQGIVDPLSGFENSPFVTVITTLGIAALFNPLRTRIQDFIDRRFYRKKYDAEKALTQFAATARDEVDMERLSAALLRVVDETMQPEKVSMWMLGGNQK